MALHVRALRRTTTRGGDRRRVSHRRSHAPGQAPGDRDIRHVQYHRAGRCGTSDGELSMNTPVASSSAHAPALELINRVRDWLERVPYTLLAIPLRLAVATVF